MVLEIAAAGQMQEGNTDAALAMFQKMLGNSPTNTAALEQCGKIYFDRGDYEKAISDYLMLVRQDSRPDYYQMLAHSYAQQNEAGKAVVLMGQAASLFGGGQISPWLKDPELDPIRESVEFRSFADRLVGVETRKAIEAINKREAEKTTPAAVPGGIQLPQQPDLNALRSGK
jgi:tetratricopeptide (TPR) repeat protein